MYQEYKTDQYWIKPNLHCDFVQIKSYVLVALGERRGPSKRAGLWVPARCEKLPAEPTPLLCSGAERGETDS